MQRDMTMLPIIVTIIVCIKTLDFGDEFFNGGQWDRYNITDGFETSLELNDSFLRLPLKCPYPIERQMEKNLLNLKQNI